MFDLESCSWTNDLCQTEAVNIKFENALNSSWKVILKDNIQSPTMRNLESFLKQEISQGKKIFPPAKDCFSALNLTPFENVKVVIMGQDPYHGQGQAHGLSFSVNEGVRFPPSLLNILKELEADLGFGRPPSGSLRPWAEQGVLLLNAVLTVEESKAGAHQGKGWEDFTDVIIHALNDQKEHLVFILWGAYAQKKGAFVNRDKHLVLESVHPSPLSAHRGFFGTKPFSKTNTYLKSHGLSPINWKLY